MLKSDQGFTASRFHCTEKLSEHLEEGMLEEADEPLTRVPCIIQLQQWQWLLILIHLQLAGGCQVCSVHLAEQPQGQHPARIQAVPPHFLIRSVANLELLPCILRTQFFIMSQNPARLQQH